MTFAELADTISDPVALPAIAAAMELAPGSWSDFPLPQRKAAVAASRQLSHRIGLVGAALNAQAYSQIPALIHDPIWREAHLRTPDDHLHLQDRLTRKFYAEQSAAALVSTLDKTSMWLGTHWLATLGQNLCFAPSNLDSGFAFFKLDQECLARSRRLPTYMGSHGVNFDASTAYARYADAITMASLASSPELFRDSPALLSVAAGAVCTGLSWDASIVDDGSPSAAQAALSAARALFERGGDSQELRQLLLLWAASGRASCAQALALSQERLPDDPFLRSSWLGLDIGQDTHICKFDLPPTIDPAWASAANTFDANGLETTRALARILPRSDAPWRVYTRPAGPHPLEPLCALWTKARQSGRQIPTETFQHLKCSFEQSAADFERDWSEWINAWRGRLQTAQSLLEANRGLEPFPGGPLENIQQLAQRSHQASPLEWRLCHSYYHNGSDYFKNPENIKYCALASAALGYDIGALFDHMDSGMTDQERCGVQAALLTLDTEEAPSSEAPPKAPRL